MTLDSYRACGLERNPFAWVDGMDPGDHLDRGLGGPPPPGAGLLVQVLGPKGAGKTTTLQHWRSHRPGPYHHVAPRGRSRWSTPPVAGICYWDEVDRMPAPVRAAALRRAARREATVVAGTHEDLFAMAARAGLVVETIVLDAITVPELRSWVRARIRRVSAGPAVEVPPETLEEVASRAGSSWRVAGDLMHAWVARQVTSSRRRSGQH